MNMNAKIRKFFFLSDKTHDIITTIFLLIGVLVIAWGVYDIVVGNGIYLYRLAIGLVFVIINLNELRHSSKKSTNYSEGDEK